MDVLDRIVHGISGTIEIGPIQDLPGQVTSATTKVSLWSPVDIGNGVRVTPPSGWVAVGSPMGQLPGVRFQRGAVTVDIAIVSYSASPRELLIAYVSQVLDSASQDAKVSEPTNVRAGNGRPTARSTYTASFKDIGTAVSGELSTQVSDNGIGIIVNGYAPQGQLAGSLGEVHEFVDTIEVRQ